MQHYEYKVVPAPAEGERARGAKTTEARMAVALASTINAEAREGWEYVRSDMLQTTERTGLSKRRQVYVSLLVFRRPVEAAATEATATEAAPKSFFRLGRLTGRAESAAPAVAPKLLLERDGGAAPKLGPAEPPEEGTAAKKVSETPS
ncbi:DUF4177 domain-containing protein [Frigidibacter sp. RF13]|uniref:DUF4177 domain-containing protein n=1 Tax=Frigidibacter sp. RF13 TaxID=2997340 RepID=UPI00226FF283|nr:DUF4177 domain-containing protein [Frigidibacter sp. RF13]MCY1128553.1 DUF4177 domain-containing protein [Frigidibacter sp. RF13]